MAGARSIICVALLLAACGGGGEQPVATATATATPAATATPQAREVTFRATDGASVKAGYTPAQRDDAPAIVLLHEIRGGREQWDPLIPYLHDAGFATLAYDSRPSQIESERLPDALGAIRWLRKRHDRLGLVGASIGASTTVLAMATGARASADAAVALSPPDSPDIWRLQEAHRYRPHDILFIADAREAPTAEAMLDGAVGSRLRQSKSRGHGVALLPDPQVRDAVVAWLTQHLT
jgi:pimeloyl-ACP methyl ester carboxylesterase